ncbi:MAG: thioredoxin family protein [Planctomycetota bacterium]|nr:thioredoxin family protein [Planctomycetota bacterium]
MHQARPLLMVFLLAATGIGDTTSSGSDVVVELKAQAPQGKARLGYSSPRQMPAETTVPRFLFEIPKFQSKQPVFFRVALGETEGVPFYGAIDKTPGSLYHDRLYLDLDRDLDLTNDGEPFKARIRTLWSTESKLVEFLNVKLALPYKLDGKQQTETYPCVFYFVLKGGKAAPPKSVLMERDGWRQGTVKVGGTPYTIAVIDDDSDGQFSTGDSWVMMPADTPADVLLGKDATRKMVFPSWSADEKWTVEVKGIGAAGRKLTVNVAAAKETERDYFMKIYKARQTDEERRFKIDPMRPKAGQNEKVDWIPGKNVKYAMDIAGRDQTPSRVLVDFTQRTCPFCHAMNKHTFTDREVYQLTKRFVCAKIKFEQGAGDTARYKVDGTPTYIILDKNGAEVARHAGFLRPTEFAAWLKAALR